MVYPSALDLATASAPMLPPLPALFSTTTVWPQSSPSFWPRMRATISVVPPGANGTTNLTTLAGQFGACAMAAELSNAHNSMPVRLRCHAFAQKYFMLAPRLESSLMQRRGRAGLVVQNRLARLHAAELHRFVGE